ncbi:MAG: radical SAM protein [Endomicrobiia bacterium]
MKPLPKKIKNVLCIYPYLQEVPIYEFFPPVGIEYIAESIRDMVNNVTVIDLRFEQNYTKFINSSLDMICISVNWYYEFENVCNIIRSLPQNIFTVVGGRQATDYIEELFQSCPNIDVIVRGDGEDTVRELVEKISPENIKGLSYRQSNKIVHNENRELPPVSNTLFPNRKFRRYKYFMSYQKVNIGPSFDSLMSSRGCPFNCKFCSFKLNPLGQKRNWSARTPESVINELKQIDAKVVAFIDDNFFADIKRAEKICDLIIQEKIKKIFIANARVSIAKYPFLIKKMYKAGFRLLMLGMESAQDKTLKQLNKGFNTAQAYEAFEIFKKSNILTNGYFIIGLIGETEQEMLAIAPYAKSLGLDIISLNRLRFEKYSGLKELLDNNKDYYVGEGNRIYSKNYGPKEINQILKIIRAKFYDKKQILSLIFKGLRIGFPDWKFVLKTFFYLPKILFKLKNRRKMKNYSST